MARWYAVLRPVILLGAVVYLVVRIAAGWPAVDDRCRQTRAQAMNQTILEFNRHERVHAQLGKSQIKVRLFIIREA